MIGNTVLEPPTRMTDFPVPAPGTRDSEWARGELARMAVNIDAIPNRKNGNGERLGKLMASGSTTDEKSSFQRGNRGGGRFV
jgi:hypothetical protein